MTDTPPEGSKLDDYLEELQHEAWKDGKDDASIHASDFQFKQTKDGIKSLLLELVDKHDPQAGKQVSERYWGNELRKEIADL